MPKEVIVVNGNPEDNKIEQVIKKYSSILNIKFINESDLGIYDAMNKGKKFATAELIHYLNAGDEVVSDIYKSISQPCLLPVEINDVENGLRWFDKPKFFGYAYCHQGLIFSKNHKPYDLKFKVSSDFNTIIKSFPKGLKKLNVSENGFVKYFLGGFSSQQSILGNYEMIMILWNQFALPKSLLISTFIIIKFFFPRKLRRLLMNAIFKKS
jgi:glycosyltransferase involved in cell wall biosynthesis